MNQPTFPSEQIRELVTKFIEEQTMFNMRVRGIEHDISHLDACERMDFHLRQIIRDAQLAAALATART